MAKVYISEFAYIGGDSGANVPVGKAPALANQVITPTGTSAQSAALNPATQYVRAVSDVPVCVACAPNPVATANSMLLPANTPEYFGVAGGNKLAVILAA